MPIYTAYDYTKQDGTQRYVIARPNELGSTQIDFTPENHINHDSVHTHTRVWDAENEGWRTLILANIKDTICGECETVEEFRNKYIDCVSDDEDSPVPMDIDEEDESEDESEDEKPVPMDIDEEDESEDEKEVDESWIIDFSIAVSIAIFFGGVAFVVKLFN